MSDQNTSTPAANTITLDATEQKNLSHISHLAAYRALQHCATTAVAQIEQIGLERRPIVLVDRIVDERDALLLSYIRARLSEAAQLLESSQPNQTRSKAAEERTTSFEPITNTLTNLTNVINSLTNVTNSLAGLLALFRSNYTLYPVTTKIDSHTLHTALAAAFKQRTWRVSFFPLLITYDDDGHPSLMSFIKKIVDNLANSSSTSRQQFLDLLKESNPFAPPPAVVTSSTDTNPATTSATTESLLARALLTEQLLHARQPLYQLAARVTQVGSDMIARKRLFSAGNLLFIGGCTIEYVLATPDGEILAANLVQSSEQITLQLSKGELSSKPLTNATA